MKKLKSAFGWIIALSLLVAMGWGMATHTLYTIGLCALITGADKTIKHYRNK